MINYVKSSIGGTELLIPARFSESFVINLDDFEYLFNIYKFIPVKSQLCFYDKKHQKTVAYLDKNLFTNKKDIHFNKNWLAHECVITRDKKLLEILHKYPENMAIYKQVDNILAKIAEQDAKYIAKGDYNKRINDYFIEQDEEDESINDNIEV
jgi:hypothetical protein